MARQRLDQRVSDQFTLSRAKAAALIMAGAVRADGQPLLKPGMMIDDAIEITVTETNHPVSRAADKLVAALDTWNIAVSDVRCLDVGSSTGGFTELLLRRGARTVVAVDVGTNQLAWSLRGDPKIELHEQTDIRSLRLEQACELATVDVSFTSLRLVLPSIAKLLTPSAPVIALFKPQFEVGRKEASRHKGVIRDRAVVTAALQEFREWCTEHHWQWLAEMPSPLTGQKGNREQLVWLQFE